MNRQESTFGVIIEGNQTFVAVEGNPTLKKIPVAAYTEKQLEHIIELQKAMIDSSGEVMVKKKEDNEFIRLLKNLFNI